MKQFIFIISILVSTNLYSEDGKMKCRKKFEEVSCGEIENSTREYFCWKKGRELSDDKKTKKCQRKPRTKKFKK